MGYAFVNRKSLDILEKLAGSPIYQKCGIVQARPAVEGEKIITILSDGREETAVIAKLDEWVVTNPSGEKYCISGSKFFNRYEETAQIGVYKAKGLVRAIVNPFEKPIEILASWGEPQYGDENCLIADVCDENGVMANEPYLIDGAAFAQTYVLLA